MSKFENTKHNIVVHLESTVGALSVEHLVQVLPSARRSTIARALRALWADNKVVRNPIVGDSKCRKMWSAPSQPATLVSPVPGAVVKAPTVQAAPPPAFSTNGTATGRLSSNTLNLSNRPKNAQGQICFAVLDGAVEHIIEGLIAKSATFSAWDVTQSLRELSNTGKIEITSIKDTVHINGYGNAAKIVHNDVRDAVHKIFFAQKMPGYDRIDNGTYHEFKPVMAPPVVLPSSQPSVATAVYDGSPTL